MQYINCKKYAGNTSVNIDLTKGFPLLPYDTNGQTTEEEYQICSPSSFPTPRGGPINVSYLSHLPKTKFFQSHKGTPIKFVYYTECDQILKFDTEQTFLALSAASNDTTFFTGRRKEKNSESNPTDYMGGLTIWRECGIPGYSLSWPKSKHVYHDL